MTLLSSRGDGKTTCDLLAKTFPDLRAQMEKLIQDRNGLELPSASLPPGQLSQQSLPRVFSSRLRRSAFESGRPFPNVRSIPLNLW